MRRVVHLTLALSLTLAVPAVAEGMSEWVRSGLEWSRAPTPQVDHTRVAAQIAAGCSPTGPIRFGDAAAWRAPLSDSVWPDSVRRNVAAAVLTDNAAGADASLRAALAEPGLTAIQRGILENQRILSALQFRDEGRARTLIEAAGPGESLPAPIRADRALWRAMATADSSGPAEWRDRLGPLLDAALASDPTSFGIRAWRAIAWLKGQGWRGKGSCEVAVADFSSRLLDLTEVGACPVMISHLDNVLARALGPDARSDADGNLAVWRRFATGLLAVIIGERATALAAEKGLAEAGGVACATLMAHELAQLRGRM